MKNLIIALCSFACAAPVMAQIPKGTSTIGGSISLQREKTDYSLAPRVTGPRTEYTVTEISVAPGYGYFVAGNLCIGLTLDASFSSGKSKGSNNGTYEKRTRSLGVGPFLRYYLPLDSKLYAYGTTSFTLQWNKVKSENVYPDGLTSSGITSSNSPAVDLGIGLSYFLNPHAALEAGVLFTHQSEPGNAGDKINTLALNVGLRIFLRRSE